LALSIVTAAPAMAEDKVKCAGIPLEKFVEMEGTRIVETTPLNGANSDMLIVYEAGQKLWISLSFNGCVFTMPLALDESIPAA
jgi:hypothetical protein